MNFRLIITDRMKQNLMDTQCQTETYDVVKSMPCSCLDSFTLRRDLYFFVEPPGCCSILYAQILLRIFVTFRDLSS